MNIYTKEHKLKVYFSTLVINIDSIKERGYDVDEFIGKYELSSLRNNNLLLVREMMSPANYLFELMSEMKQNDKLENKKHYVLIYERLLEGVEGKPNYIEFGVELSETYKLDWVKSIITKKGCFVWKI